MQPVNSFPKIATDGSLRETARHGSAAYPFQYYLEDVWDFDLHCIDWHWHPELEFVYVRTGAVEVSAGGQEHTLPVGCGMFITRQVTHRFWARQSARMPNFLFLPSLLAPEGSLIYTRSILPVLMSAPPCLLLDPQTPWQADVLRIMNAIFDLHEAHAPDREFAVLRLLMALWEALLHHLDPHAPEAAAISGDQDRLQTMLAFIHEHYREPLALQSIADAVYLSKSSALQIFRRGVRMSPVAYLIRYRLQRAAQLLRATQKSVSAIAEETGFASAGYFCRRFKELFQLSPNAYRRQRQCGGPAAPAHVSLDNRPSPPYGASVLSIPTGAAP